MSLNRVFWPYVKYLSFFSGKISCKSVIKFLGAFDLNHFQAIAIDCTVKRGMVGVELQGYYDSDSTLQEASRWVSLLMAMMLAEVLMVLSIFTSSMNLADFSKFSSVSFTFMFSSRLKAMLQIIFSKMSYQKKILLDGWLHE